MAYADGTLVNVSGHENTALGRTWQYTTADNTVAQVAASGFFNTITKTLQKGDIVDIRGSNGTALAIVTSETAAATVTLGAFTALT